MIHYMYCILYIVHTAQDTTVDRTGEHHKLTVLALHNYVHKELLLMR
jgi:hypothetical protein